MRQRMFSAARSVYAVALAAVAGAGLYDTTLSAYVVCDICACHRNHNNCSEDHTPLCGQTGEECYTHEGTLCSKNEIEVN